MFSVSIDGAAIDTENLDNESVNIELGMPSDEETQCKHCGEVIDEYTNGWFHSDDNSRMCNGLDYDDVRRELDLDDESEVTEELIRKETEFTFAEPRDKVAADYVNWAGISVNENRIEVQISVGDPRGCLVMSVEPHADEDGNVFLVLHTPYAGMTMPHVPLVQLHDGAARINVSQS